MDWISCVLFDIKRNTVIKIACGYLLKLLSYHKWVNQIYFILMRRYILFASLLSVNNQT